ncbi:MAG TPA: glycosyltransferase family 4 protein [Ignavibacteriales bacterium]|nr:glycosyltransferase family 4 protein [Ignavibacteriales bacterium]
MAKAKNILFLTHYFPPEVNAPANRTHEHAKEWVKTNKVTVVTNFPNHPDGKIFPGYKNKFIMKENIDGINVIRLWTFITPNEGFVLRTLNYIIYMILSFFYVTFSGIKFDVIIATTPQFFCALSGKYIAKFRKKPFILELRDLWPESIINVGALRNKAIINILERMELDLYRSADAIISVTQSFKANLAGRGIEPDKIHIIYNGVYLDSFTNGKAISNKELTEYISTGFIIGYIGTTGMAHSIITLVEAAQKTNRKDIKFIIVGSGAERDKLEREIQTRGLNNIRIFPIQPRSEIASIIKSLDLFCIHLKRNSLFKTVIPSKLFEGMIMKKPILMGVDGESRKIVEDAGCGLFFEPENADDLLAKLDMYVNNKKLMTEHGENGYKFVMENFDRKKLAGNMLEIIERV